jgi:hypothetical protein
MLGRPAPFPDELPFKLRAFARLAFASEEAEIRWRDAFERCGLLWQDLEYESVRVGIRRCGIYQGTELETFSHRALVDGLSITCVRHGASPALLYGTKDAVIEGHQLHAIGQHEALGLMLGFPPCCARFFSAVYEGFGYEDTTWHQAVGRGEAWAAREIQCPTPSLANVLLRSVGVRAVPHLPCSFDCDESVALAERILAPGDGLGAGSTIQLIRSILEWPMAWSALHGIAELHTPVMRLVTNTVATGETYRVRVEGRTWPHEGVSGAEFPFYSPVRVSREAHSRPASTDAPSVPLVRLAKPHSVEREQEASMNGFTSWRAMVKCHEELLSLFEVPGFREHIASNGVLDLGAGTGRLAELVAGKLASEAWGVEEKLERVLAGQRYRPTVRLVCGDYLDADAWAQLPPSFGLVVLSARAMLGMSYIEREQVFDAIHEKGAVLLSYWHRERGLSLDLRGVAVQVLGRPIVEVGARAFLIDVRSAHAVGAERPPTFAAG